MQSVVSVFSFDVRIYPVIYQEECCPKGQTKDHRTSQVCLVHDAAICCFHRMEHRQSLLPDVVKINA